MSSEYDLVMLWVPIPNSLGKKMLKKSKTIEKKNVYMLNPDIFAVICSC
jgi:hypothetical protein